MARYGQAYKGKAVERLLPPESAALEVVARDMGVEARTLERWREVWARCAAFRNYRRW